MKKWNTPAIAEINLSEPADGFFNIGWEGPFNIVFGDRSCPEKPQKPEKPEKPDTPTDPVNSNS